jgi:hypothetical protein
MNMTSLLNKSGVIVFSIIGALLIIGAAWMTKGSESNDAWLYVFSIWMILFSAFEVRTSVQTSKTLRLVFAVLAGASAIVLGAWWINGAEHAWLFLTCVATLVVAFFILLPKKK